MGVSGLTQSTPLCIASLTFMANIRKSAAITERNPYLESRLLAQGTLDARLPPRDVTLLTTSASLVAREGLHPALKRLAIAVAMPVGGVLLLVHWALIVRGYVLERKFAADAHFDATASASL